MAIRPCSEWLWSAVILQWDTIQLHTDAYADTPSRAESYSAQLILNGDNMLGLCDPSNFLLFEYSFYPPRSDALFSNYFKDLFFIFRCSKGWAIFHLTSEYCKLGKQHFKWHLTNRNSGASFGERYCITVPTCPDIIWGKGVHSQNIWEWRCHIPNWSKRLNTAGSRKQRHTIVQGFTEPEHVWRSCGLLGNKVNEGVVSWLVINRQAGLPPCGFTANGG